MNDLAEKALVNYPPTLTEPVEVDVRTVFQTDGGITYNPQTRETTFSKDVTINPTAEGIIEIHETLVLMGNLTLLSEVPITSGRYQDE